MGVDGQVSTEPGGSNDDKIFFMKYPLPVLKYWYETFPLSQEETTTTGTSIVSPSTVVVDPDMSGESIREMLSSHTFPPARLLS